MGAFPQGRAFRVRTSRRETSCTLGAHPCYATRAFTSRVPDASSSLGPVSPTATVGFWTTVPTMSSPSAATQSPSTRCPRTRGSPTPPSSPSFYPFPSRALARSPGRRGSQIRTPTTPRRPRLSLCAPPMPLAKALRGHMRAAGTDWPHKTRCLMVHTPTPGSFPFFSSPSPSLFLPLFPAARLDLSGVQQAKCHDVSFPPSPLPVKFECPPQAPVLRITSHSSID